MVAAAVVGLWQRRRRWRWRRGRVRLGRSILRGWKWCGRRLWRSRVHRRWWCRAVGRRWRRRRFVVGRRRCRRSILWRRWSGWRSRMPTGPRLRRASSVLRSDLRRGAMRCRPAADWIGLSERRMRRDGQLRGVPRRGRLLGRGRLPHRRLREQQLHPHATRGWSALRRGAFLRRGRAMQRLRAGLHTDLMPDGDVRPGHVPAQQQARQHGVPRGALQRRPMRPVHDLVRLPGRRSRRRSWVRQLHLLGLQRQPHLRYLQ